MHLLCCKISPHPHFCVSSQITEGLGKQETSRELESVHTRLH